MSSEPTITLYDISSKLSPQAWSPNTWKARIVLNYKRIPYKTVWVSYPDIRPTLESIGGKPTGVNRDGVLYTLPAILDTSSGSPVVISDSLAIAEYLDEKYPDRPVFPKEGKALVYAFEEALLSIIISGGHLRNLVVPAAWKILDDRGQPYFRETRERWYGQGKKLEDWCPEGPEREAAWEGFQKSWDKLAKILDRNGPNVDYVAGGSHPTLPDIIVVSYLAWLILVLPEEWDKRIRHWSGGRWERLWKLTEEWRTVI